MRGRAALIVLSAILLGCGPKQDDTTFLVIDGKSLTAEAVRQVVLVQARMLELSGAPIEPGKFAGWANSAGMRMIGPLANNMLMQAEIERAKIVPELPDYALALTNLNRQSGQNAATIGQLAEKFGKLKPELLRQYEYAAGLSAYARRFWHVTPSDESARRYLDFKKKERASAAKIDAAALEKARRAHERLKAGEPWDLVARECSEDKLLNPGNERMAKEWGWMTSDAMGLKELSIALPNLNVGEFTGPLDTQAGMLIVKLLEKKGKLFRVARILFRMSLPVEVPADLEQARAILSEKALSGRRESTLRALEEKARIEYPLGTNFTYKIWKDAEQ